MSRNVFSSPLSTKHEVRTSSSDSALGLPTVSCLRNLKLPSLGIESLLIGQCAVNALTSTDRRRQVALLGLDVDLFSADGDANMISPGRLWSDSSRLRLSARSKAGHRGATGAVRQHVARLRRTLALDRRERLTMPRPCPRAPVE